MLIFQYYLYSTLCMYICMHIRLYIRMYVIYMYVYLVWRDLFGIFILLNIIKQPPRGITKWTHIYVCVLPFLITC